MSRRDRTRIVDDPATIGADAPLDRRTLPDRRMYKPRRDWERLARARGQIAPWNGLERRRRVAGAPVWRRVGQRRRGRKVSP